MTERTPARHRAQCGTQKGYRTHSRRGEHQCPDCAEANRIYKKTWRIDGTEKAMTNEEIAAEVEHLLRLNQGSHTILKALGYTTNPTTLERRLQRAKRPDLIPRLFHMQDQAA